MICNIHSSISRESKTKEALYLKEVKGMDSIMRIVQINAVYEYSSTGRIVQELHNKIMSKGHSSYVFCTNVENQNNHVYCIGTRLGRKIHGLLSRLTGLQGYYSSRATMLLLKQLDNVRPDIVHLHNLHGNYINVNMLLDYLIKKQIAVVITLHDCWFFTGHCCHYLEDNCDRWKYGCGNCPSRHKWNKSWFFDKSEKVYKDRKRRFTKLKSLTVVGVSDWITNEAKASFFKENGHFLRIYNWIDLELFTPCSRDENYRKRVLSVSQGWSNIKGLSDIINVAKENPEFDFIIVGDMPKEVDLPFNVYAVGVINDLQQLIKEYQKADVFLHLSYQETFGKVIGEALACGTPAIVYNATAMPELIGENCGTVVETGNWRAASLAVKRLGDYNREMCRKYAEDKFDMSVLLEKWMDLYTCIEKNQRSKG